MCLDSFFNKNIPESTKDTFIFPPSGKTWINGMANCYEVKYFHELTPYISEIELTIILIRINDEIFSYWPCPMCFAIGYGCAICTVGLSFLCPFICIRDAKSHLLANIDKFNRSTLNQRSLNLEYKTICCTSYLELKITNRGKLISNYNQTSNNQISI